MGSLRVRVAMTYGLVEYDKVIVCLVVSWGRPGGGGEGRREFRIIGHAEGAAGSAPEGTQEEEGILWRDLARLGCFALSAGHALVPFWGIDGWSRVTSVTRGCLEIVGSTS